ncbi:hypothetical protein BSLG_003932 [Batrachochytrium salamandrivorans]|nr:hypothetical protein BSLG_003932 [Batrachochytrium salamandrivorans]
MCNPLHLLSALTVILAVNGAVIPVVNNPIHDDVVLESRSVLPESHEVHMERRAPGYGTPGSFWGSQGPSMNPQGQSWGPQGAILGTAGTSLETARTILGTARTILGTAGTILGTAKAIHESARTIDGTSRTNQATFSHKRSATQRDARPLIL